MEINLGNQHQKSKLHLKIETAGNTNTKLSAGDQFDQSSRTLDLKDGTEIREVEYEQLTSELKKLREYLEQNSQGQHTEAIASIKQAEESSSAGNWDKTKKALLKSGEWALETGRKIGVPIAVAAIKAALDLS
jgi:hypothetical protein